MKKYRTLLILTFLAVLVVPIGVAHLFPPERRRFEWVELEETVHREVTFRNEEGGLDLAGLLFVPEGEGPFPGAVIIHGSGTSHRDNGWYLTLVRYLQANGVAVLLPDKRGSGSSGGDWRTASLEDLATDTVAGVRFLAERAEVRVSRVGVVGLSQGGHIAPVAAVRTDRIAFVVNIVGGAVPMHELLVYEENHNLREMGILPGLSDLLARVSAWSIIQLRQRAFWEAIGNFDPVPYWRKVAVRSLVLYGEEDRNVPAGRSARILRSLGKPNIEVRIYAGSGHALESPPGEGNSILREDALVAIRDFIRSTTGPPQAGPVVD